MAFAVAIMLTATFLPHHHHNGMLCTTVEYCEDDHKYNDEHTNHRSNNGDETKCLEHSDYLFSKRSLDNVDVRANLLPLFVIAEQFLLCFDLYHKDIRIRYFSWQSLYQSAYVGLINTLRGPPSLFV